MNEVETDAPLVLERTYDVPPDRVFDVVTRADLLGRWWGPEGIVRSIGDLDFTRTGPWNSTMINAEGARFKVSGQVTRVERPVLVAFTWGWHDENDRRGRESHVTIELSAAGAGKTRFVLTHRDLPDADQQTRHAEGWTSSLRKLAAALGA